MELLRLIPKALVGTRIRTYLLHNTKFPKIEPEEVFNHKHEIYKICKEYCPELTLEDLTIQMKLGLQAALAGRT